MQTDVSVVAVFRKYARYGYDKVDFNIFEICALARGVAPNTAVASELVAVYQTLCALEFFGKSETAEAVRNVYFKYPERPLKKNEVSWRVRRFAFEKNMDERTVYRRLQTAKNLFFKFYENGIKNIK